MNVRDITEHAPIRAVCFAWFLIVSTSHWGDFKWTGTFYSVITVTKTSLHHYELIVLITMTYLLRILHWIACRGTNFADILYEIRRFQRYRQIIFQELNNFLKKISIIIRSYFCHCVIYAIILETRNCKLLFCDSIGRKNRSKSRSSVETCMLGLRNHHRGGSLGCYTKVRGLGWKPRPRTLV